MARIKVGGFATLKQPEHGERTVLVTAVDSEWVTGILSFEDDHFKPRTFLRSEFV